MKKILNNAPNRLATIQLNTATLLCLLLCNVLSAQLAINGNVYITSEGQLHVAVPQTYFISGEVLADRGTAQQYGIMSFAEQSVVEQADHNSHVNGFVRSYNNDNFIYAIGQNKVLQQVRIKSDVPGALLDFAYNNIAHQNTTTDEDLAKVSDEFYWTVKGQGKATIYLSWNTFSNLDKLTDNQLENLTIAAFDGSTWKNIPATLDEISFTDGAAPTLISGSLRSVDMVDPLLYSALSLARIKDTEISYDFNVSEAITRNGDGINETWYIEDIENHPNANIKVFNRLGQTVFETKGYQNNWAGNFKNNSDITPEAAYFYTIDVDDDGTVDKSGWLYITQ